MAQSGWFHRNFTRRIGRYLHPVWPREMDDIVFVVGCPRSGTTVLGQILSRYPGFLYLHEPRYIWRQVNPQLNVWGADAGGGVLYWDENDVDASEARRLARWFQLALDVSGQRRLVVKQPLNVFRMRWLAAMFPNARFIHLVRHARDVALSLQEALATWFSPEQGYPREYWESNWNYLMFQDYAKGRAELSQELAAIQGGADNYARSLFVWLCSVWEGCRAGKEIGPEKYIQLHYEDLIHDPATQLARVFDLVEEPMDEGTVTSAQTLLHGRSLGKADPDPELTAAVAGRMLEELGYEV